MDYRFESLNDDEFQALCQAILVKTHPNVQCFPLGQADGGRDAIAFIPSKDGAQNFIVFQVKFTKNPSAKNERKSIQELVKAEAQKINRLAKKGAIKYYLMTNITGSGGLDVGAIDKVHDELSALLNIEAHCWWRDDIARRLDGERDIKWSYPKILDPIHFFEIFVRHGADPNEQRRAATLKSYIAEQFRRDSQLKFKQVDLLKDINALFVDVPVAIIRPLHLVNDPNWSQKLSEMRLSHLATGFQPKATFLDGRHNHQGETVGAYELLSRADVVQNFPLIVLEGAPGQGKSTVTQYLCQSYRRRLINSTPDKLDAELSQSPDLLLIPFRFDLRDYATWLSGKDPFSEDDGAPLPSASGSVLESFVAAHIVKHTGQSFSVDDLVAVARLSQILIVLDGFDEVADVSTRNRLVEEIFDSAKRLGAISSKLQVIVTSRPAAFANSPGFPHEQWQHLHLLSLPRQAIEVYANKWLDARNADIFEKKSVLNLLRDKLEQDHVRDLARNPMQLAILLNLISVQGESLPDERTSLYGKYIEIFFNRESEKSLIVRDNRKLVINVHRFIAWNLQLEVENNGPGNIAEPRLKSMIHNYLQEIGGNATLLDNLFVGMKERVGALVSRIQGTYEFEVQPLREYFAACHLYDTAPDTGRAGTVPEIFSTIASNFFWLNVTRFFAGCYSTGELSSLIHGLEDLSRRDRFALISHPRKLGVALLSDYVFDQYPNIADKLVEFIVDEPGYRILVSNILASPGEPILRLPTRSGQRVLVEKCKATLEIERGTDVVFATCVILRANATDDKLISIWADLRQNFSDDLDWLMIGEFLNISHTLDHEQCFSIIKDTNGAALSLIGHSGRFDLVKREPLLLRKALEEFLDRDQFSVIYGLSKDYEERFFRTFSFYFGKFGMEALFSLSNLPETIEEIEMRFSGVESVGDYGIDTIRINENPAWVSKKFQDVFHVFLKSEPAQWRSELKLWRSLLEDLRTEFGDRRAIFSIAVRIISHFNVFRGSRVNLFDQSAPVIDMAMSARYLRNDLEWWRMNFSLSVGADSARRIFMLISLASWMPLDKFADLQPEISLFLDGLSVAELLQVLEWKDEYHWRYRVRRYEKLNRERLLGTPIGKNKRFAALLACLLPSTHSYLVYQRFLVGYENSDNFILAVCSQILSARAYLVKNSWTQALPVISLAYQNGLNTETVQNRRDAKKETFEMADAILVCRNPNVYPLSLVNKAQEILTILAGKEAELVGDVSERDGWFGRNK